MLSSSLRFPHIHPWRELRLTPPSPPPLLRFTVSINSFGRVFPEAFFGLSIQGHVAGPIPDGALPAVIVVEMCALFLFPLPLHLFRSVDLRHEF